MSWLDKLTTSQKVALLGAVGLIGGPVGVASAAAAAATGSLLTGTASRDDSDEGGDTAVVLNKEMSQQMQRISNQTGLSEGEVLKRALALMETVVLAAREGHSLALLDQSGDVEANITGLTKGEAKN